MLNFFVKSFLGKIILNKIFWSNFEMKIFFILLALRHLYVTFHFFFHSASISFFFFHFFQYVNHNLDYCNIYDNSAKMYKYYFRFRMQN